MCSLKPQSALEKHGSQIRQVPHAQKSRVRQVYRRTQSHQTAQTQSPFRKKKKKKKILCTLLNPD